MNSMNNIIKQIDDVLTITNSEIITNRQFAIDINSGDVHQSLAYLKSIGFTQLSILTCIDLIANNEFQLIYILNNWELGLFVIVRTIIPRDNPAFVTIINIFPGAKYYEREVHEFFGVTFEGNDSYSKPLLLEIWDDIPPLRKDFDPQVYSDSKFPKRDLDKIYRSKIGGVD